MKKIFLTAITGFILTGCADKKADKKTIFDDVMKVHEKVMGADEQLMKNKMQLDTLLKQGSPAQKDTALLLSKKLNAADSTMTNWMHKFDPDYKGKNDDETVTYLNDQKKQIMAIDSEINLAIDQSNKYLLKAKKK